jgi:hypothetical protein
MGTSQPVWPVLRNGGYMVPAHMLSTELVAYLSLSCWYKEDRSGRWRAFADDSTTVGGEK